jgi:hypothetical protein
MLAMYFVHDGGNTSEWRLKGHAKHHFYSWVGTWASVIVTPANLGFTEESKKYELPNLEYIEHKIKVPLEEGSETLFNESNVNATEFNAELRKTLKLRVEKTVSIVNEIGNKEQILIWVNQNEEGDQIERQLKELGFNCRQVSGSDSIVEKEKNLLDFADAKYQILITKAKIAGMGMNFQSCHVQIFASLDFSFEKLYQSVRRSYRFGQKEQVKVYLITTDTMENVIGTIREKDAMFTELRDEMQKTINNKGIVMELKTFNNMDKVSKAYKLMQGDCIQRIKEIESESVGLSVFSPPFADLYTYSNNIEDMGNCNGWEEFMVHWSFLTKELYRVVKQGRNVAIHCMDLPIQKGKEGYIGLRDFSGMILESMLKEGFIYHSRITIWKDPVVEMQRTKALGLLHKQVKKDSTMSRVGLPDYVLVFRKDGERNEPVQNTELSVDLWQKIASPVWMDINYSNTLQHRSAREEEDEKHICPLQLETIERLIYLYSNKNDLVFTPFLGIGSEVYQAVKQGRRGLGIELKESYFDQACKNLELLEKEQTQMDLFGT